MPLKSLSNIINNRNVVCMLKYQMCHETAVKKHGNSKIRADFSHYIDSR